MYLPTEAARILGVTGPTVHNKLKVLRKELLPYIQNIRGHVYINDTGIEIIRNSISYNKVNKYNIRKESVKTKQYDNFDIQQLNYELKNTNLNPIQLKELESLVNEIKCSEWRVNEKSKLENYIDLYKLRYLLEILTEIMARYFNISRVQIYRKLKEMGWTYTKKQSAQIATKIKNYSQISIKGKKTLLKKSTRLFGSDQENYVRQKLNLYLGDFLEGADIIVGVNSPYILDGGYEVDIPIIIFFNNQVYKYAIEVNGDYWHNKQITQKHDKEKSLKLKDKGYQLFNILLSSSLSNKEKYGDIDTQIAYVIHTISNNILNNK
jgi:hypothetical protein